MNDETFIKLPCKVGDTFYYLEHWTVGGVIRNKFRICESIVSDFLYNGELFFHDIYGFLYKPDEVFFNFEEAEAEKERRNYL